MTAVAVVPTVRSSATEGTPDGRANGRERMDGASRTLDRRAVWLAWGVVAGIVVFNLGWLLARRHAEGWLLGGQSRHQRPWSPDRPVPVGDAHRPRHRGNADHPVRALRAPPRPGGAWPGPALGAWLLAASLMGLDNLSDVFGSNAGRPTRAAPPQPPPAPGMAGCTSRSVCSAGSPRSRPHTPSRPDASRRRLA
jgi:hypothetical protein